MTNKILASLAIIQFVTITAPMQAIDDNKGYCCHGNPCETKNCGEYTCLPPIQEYKEYDVPINGNCGITFGSCCDSEYNCIFVHYCNIET